jgi:hypothetical protein
VAERPERVEIVGTARHVGRGDCIVLADARCSRVVRRVRGYMLGLRLARVGDRPRPTRPRFRMGGPPGKRKPA